MQENRVLAVVVKGLEAFDNAKAHSYTELFPVPKIVLQLLHWHAAAPTCSCTSIVH